jgi:hypothetical protein
MERMGLAYLSASESQPGQFFYQAEKLRAVDVSGWQYLFHANLTGRAPLLVGGDTLVFEPAPGGTLRMAWRGREIGIASIEDVLRRLGPAGASPISPTNTVPPELLALDVDTDNLQIRIAFTTLSGRRREDTLDVSTAAADILVTIR